MKEYPRRKQLRLKGFDYSQNGYYYITVCTYNRQKLFTEIVGATLRGRPDSPGKMIEKWLLELENKFCDVRICEYVVMPDHLHFIISKMSDIPGATGDHTGSPLREIVGWFKSMTTNEYINNVKNNIYPPFDKKNMATQLL